jgi:hypothetical protein
MAIDVKAVDRKINRRIKKLERFKEFAKEFGDDPEFQELIAEFITSKNGPHPTPCADATTSATAAVNENGSRPRGYFLGAVQGVILGLGEFTSQDIENELRSRGVEIRAANANISINEALRTLEDRGQISRTGKRNKAQIVWRKAISAVGESRTA